MMCSQNTGARGCLPLEPNGKLVRFARAVFEAYWGEDCHDRATIPGIVPISIYRDATCLAGGRSWVASARVSVLAAPATLGAQRSIIATIPAGSGSRPQLSKCPVILWSAIDQFLNPKKYHRLLILEGFLIAF
jgi:hypothetical protein